MAGWFGFALALTVFLLAHVIPMLPPVRTRLIAVMGRAGYFSVYGVASIVLLGWVIVAAGRAPFVPLADQTIWARWLVNLLMPLAIMLTVFGVATPNPFGAGRKAGHFDVEHPGILGVTRHPLMWAFALWALGHLLANPDLAHAILFGLMLGFAGLGMQRAETRARNSGALAQYGAQTGFWPFEALISGRWRPRRLPSPVLLAVCAGVWLLIYALHPVVIGVSPVP